MSHLNLETLARLVDDSPDPTEAGHLDICAQCRDELEALRADAAALRQLPDPEPPIAAWVALEQRLQREGLVRRRVWVSNVLRMAAAIAIFIFGSVAGALVMRQRTTELANLGSADRNSIQTAAPQQIVPETVHAGSVVATAAPLASTLAPVTTAAEADARLREAERAYLAALTSYQDFHPRTQAPADPVARLAALESIVATTRAALGQAPADPIINGYHLTAVAQRDATLRQIAASKQQTQTWY